MYEHRYGVSSLDPLLHDPPPPTGEPVLIGSLPAVPTVPIKETTRDATGAVSEDSGLGSALYLADNLALMHMLLERGERFDLIYVDPPFNSGKAYSARRPPAGENRFSTPVPAYADVQGHDAYLLW